MSSLNILRISRELANRPSDPRVPLLALAFVSVTRVLLEQAFLGEPSGAYYLSYLVWQTWAFYVLAFMLYTVVLRTLGGLDVRAAAHPIAVGLIFGLVPPLLELYFVPANEVRFIYFPELTWSLFHERQRLGESVGIWAMIVVTGLYMWAATRSKVRGFACMLGAYAIVQLFSAYAIWGMAYNDRFERDAGTAFLHGSFVALAAALFVLLRVRALLPSLRRMHHALPHVALVLGGNAWAGRAVEDALLAVAVVFGAVFVLMVQNDWYDRSEDTRAGRAVLLDPYDVGWVHAFALAGLVPLLVYRPMLGLCALGLVLAGLLYHHPATRLKTRFCLSYQCEGAGAAFAFSAGAVTTLGYPDAPLLWPLTLVFFGGALLSAVKDWKDVAADRAAGIPTFYVAFSQDDDGATRVHRVLVACVAASMLLATYLVSEQSGVGMPIGVMLLVTLITVLGVLLTSRRRLAVSLAMWGYAAFLSAGAWAIASMA